MQGDPHLLVLDLLEHDSAYPRDRLPISPQAASRFFVAIDAVGRITPKHAAMAGLMGC